MDELKRTADLIRTVNSNNKWDVFQPEDEGNEFKIRRIHMLIKSEISEALEALRNRDIPNFFEELADIAIRILDFQGYSEEFFKILYEMFFSGGLPRHQEWVDLAFHTLEEIETTESQKFIDQSLDFLFVLDMILNSDINDTDLTYLNMLDKDYTIDLQTYRYDLAKVFFLIYCYSWLFRRYLLFEIATKVDRNAERGVRHGYKAF